MAFFGKKPDPHRPVPCGMCGGSGQSRLAPKTCTRCGGSGIDPYASR